MPTFNLLVISKEGIFVVTVVGWYHIRDHTQYLKQTMSIVT
jgi:hypothetical protein